MANTSNTFSAVGRGHTGWANGTQTQRNNEIKAARELFVVI